MTEEIMCVDLTAWFDHSDRAGVARRFDEALRRAGFLLITGHGIETGLRAEARAAAREFFALPRSVKARYAGTGGGRGWLSSGIETAALGEGTATPPDMKESYSIGCDDPTGDPEVDAVWFPPNHWPDAELPHLRPILSRYVRRVLSLSRELMVLSETALGLPRSLFTSCQRHPTWSCYLNWYPPMTVVGPPLPGQFRIGPHTDFGAVTVLDREPGAGGLQVYTDAGNWIDVPFHPDFLTVNIGDMMARWTGDRWRSTRHRVLPPQRTAPTEDLLSLAFFYEVDHDALIETVAGPDGGHTYPPVRWSDYLSGKVADIAPG